MDYKKINKQKSFIKRIHFQAYIGCFVEFLAASVQIPFYNCVTLKLFLALCQQNSTECQCLIGLILLGNFGLQGKHTVQM